LLLVFAVPTAVSADFPPVIAVYPPGPTVPENLLRISIRFARPLDQPVLEEIALRNVGGSIIDTAFLEQELWSPDGTVLTLLLHPGRVKTGLLAHELLGRALVEGGAVELLTGGRAIKSWNVGSEKRVPPDPAKWNALAPTADTLTPLRVVLEAPIDALAANMIAVATPDGPRVAGRATLAVSESVWNFVPDKAWASVSYKVRVHPRLEDVAGNEVGQPFEGPVQQVPPEAQRGAELRFSIN
jgi:hypothetical protein